MGRGGGGWKDKIDWRRDWEDEDEALQSPAPLRMSAPAKNFGPVTFSPVTRNQG
jgi:hypothetical protein